MARIELGDAQAWLEPSKAELDEFDVDLLEQVETQVLSALVGTGYDTSTWVDTTSTPDLIKSIISMLYASYYLQRQYSEDQEVDNPWAKRLYDMATANIRGLISGTLTLTDTSDFTVAGAPAFYPTDASSAACPDYYDKSLGDARFSMGMEF
jgi:hypothetical protein